MLKVQRICYNRKLHHNSFPPQQTSQYFVFLMTDFPTILSNQWHLLHLLSNNDNLLPFRVIMTVYFTFLSSNDCLFVIFSSSLASSLICSCCSRSWLFQYSRFFSNSRCSLFKSSIWVSNSTIHKLLIKYKQIYTTQGKRLLDQELFLFAFPQHIILTV